MPDTVKGRCKKGQTEDRQRHTSARAQAQSCNPQSEQYGCFAWWFPSHSLHRPPMWRFIVPALFLFAFHCYSASTNILLYAQKPRPGQPPYAALIHPSVNPHAPLTTPSQLFDIMLLWLSGPLCCLLSEADWRLFVCVSLCPKWPGGTCQAGRGTGMQMWMAQCVLGTCWQIKKKNSMPLWVLVHQRTHLVQLHMQLSVAFPAVIHAESRYCLQHGIILLFTIVGDSSETPPPQL